MRVSRAPEKRGGPNKTIIILSLIVAAVIIGVLVTYFATGVESRSANGGLLGGSNPAPNGTSGANQSDPTPTTSPTATPMPTTPTPETAAATPAPTAALRMPENEPQSPSALIPQVQFGEVLAEGFVDVQLPGNNTAPSWYTFQVDTVSRDIILFFAVYNEAQDTIIRTVKVEGYSQGGDLQKAEVTLFYAEGPERVMLFERDPGTITVTQAMRQPYGPSLFSPELRVSLVNQRTTLQDETGAISAELQLDLTGLSDSEVMVFKRSAPETVANVLSEVQGLVRQIEDKRPR